MLYRPEDRGILTLREALLDIAALGWQFDDALQLEGTSNWGRFEGDLMVQFLDDGRLCKVLQRYAFVRPDGTLWVVPPETVVDGASIPRPFWSVIGGPFEGRYRNASVVHDRYCDTRERPWRDTHRMFYEAMRCRGVPPLKAKVMFYAVNRFGPRWPQPDGLVPETPFLKTAATDADAPSLLADAEAIFVHDLGLEEIERLADARRAGLPVVEGPFSPSGSGRMARARSLVVCGGRGDAADLEAVASEVALLPDYVLRHFERKRIRVVACHDAITDFEADLKGVVPRGWESTGRTWDSVPGTYFDDRRRVVIATIASPTGGREVPTRASRLHGSDNLVIHECLHGFDYSGDHAVLAEPRFVSARTADLPRLRSAMDGYLIQEGRPGLEETFAESGARSVVNKADMAAEWPNLHAYWLDGPAGQLESPLPSIEIENSPVDEEQPLGYATLLPGGGLSLNLRAEGPGGAIGHAIIDIVPGDRAYREVLSLLLGDAPVPESATPVTLPYFASRSSSQD